MVGREGCLSVSASDLESGRDEHVQLMTISSPGEIGR